MRQLFSSIPGQVLDFIVVRIGVGWDRKAA